MQDFISNIVIDKDVPIGKKTLKSVIADLEVGESFAFPFEKRNSVVSTANILVKEFPGRTFITRKIDDSTGRIWRTK